MEKVKVFFSQPMRGKTEKQIREEREQFWEVFKPRCAKYLGIPEEELELIDSVFSEPDASTIHLLAKSIDIMQGADVVAFMHGWKESRGCRVEFDVATKYADELGLKIVYFF